MGTLPRILVVVAVWLAYVFILTRACSDVLCEGCMGASAAAPVGEEAVTRYPIDFQWSDPTAFTNAGFDRYRQELLDGQAEDNILELTGRYFADEETPEGYANMGFARAESARRRLVPDLDDSRVLKKARLVAAPAGAREGYFEAVAYQWLSPDNTIAASLERLEDRIHIRFPFASDDRDYDPEVSGYLRELAEELQGNDIRILLIGHTDNVGDAEFNEQLGLERAQEVREELIGLGVPPDRIEVESRGARQPTASNDTERGRHENRRVEIRNLPR